VTTDTATSGLSMWSKTGIMRETNERFSFVDRVHEGLFIITLHENTQSLTFNKIHKNFSYTDPLTFVIILDCMFFSLLHIQYLETRINHDRKDKRRSLIIGKRLIVCNLVLFTTQ
jgi:uncharacterized protein Veg